MCYYYLSHLLVLCVTLLFGPINVLGANMDICYNHPQIHCSLLETCSNGYVYPQGHKLLQSWAQTLPGWPSGDHDNVDGLMQNMEQYESDHPNMDNYVNRLGPLAQCYDFSGVKYPAPGVCPAGTSSYHTVRTLIYICMHFCMTMHAMFSFAANRRRYCQRQHCVPSQPPPDPAPVCALDAK